MAIGLKQEDTIYSFSNYDLSNCSGGGEQKTPSTTSWSPSLEREAYLLRLRRMKKYSKMPRKYWNISRLIHPKRWYLSLPLEGGGPLAVEGVLYPNAQINTRLSL